MHLRGVLRMDLNDNIMKKQMMTGAEAVIASLIIEGVTDLFGYPGGAIMPIYDALYGEKNKLNHLLVRHEQGAIHAAQGYARVTGKVGVVFATSGPGATNLITGLADAQIDSTPLVCITGQVASSLLGTDAFQETDVMAIAMPVTKWQAQVRRAEDIPKVIAKAFYIAKSGRPGPVIIDITKDAQFERFEFDYEVCRSIRTYQSIPEVDLEVLDQVVDLLNKAEKPLLLIGQGILLSKAEEALNAFLEKTGIPVASTLLGLGAVSTTHPLYVGFVGMHGDYAPNLKTNECDVLLAIGMRFDDRVTGDVSRYAKQAKIIHIDIDASELNKIIPATVAIHADAKEALEYLVSKIKSKRYDDWLLQFKLQSDYATEVLTKNLPALSSSEIRMEAVVELLSELTNGTAIIVTDVGQHQMVTARNYDYKRPRTNVTSGGLGTMGFALPAAIGAKVGKSSQQVIALIGDGGFQMTIQELGTIFQSDVAVKIIILNNRYLGMVRQWQELFFEKRYSFTEMISPDFVGVAKAYGIAGDYVENWNDLKRAITSLLEHPEAYLLEVEVLKEDNVFPMIPTGASVSEIRLQ